MKNLIFGSFLLFFMSFIVVAEQQQTNQNESSYLSLCLLSEHYDVCFRQTREYAPAVESEIALKTTAEQNYLLERPGNFSDPTSIAGSSSSIYALVLLVLLIRFASEKRA